LPAVSCNPVPSTLPSNEELTGALHLVDLAGSERLDKSLDPGSWGDGYPAENEGTISIGKYIFQPLNVVWFSGGMFVL